jgi:hypothetical protein
LPASFALSGSVKRGILSTQFVNGRRAGLSSINTRRLAQAFREAFPVCVRWQPCGIGKTIDTGLVKDVPNICGCYGLS